jgi:TonB family protein
MKLSEIAAVTAWLLAPAGVFVANGSAAAGDDALAQDDDEDSTSGGDEAGGSQTPGLPPEPASGEIRNLLDSIPEIANPEQPAAQAPPPPSEPLSFPDYVDDVRAAVLARWEPSRGMIEKNHKLESQVLFRIAEEGSIIEVVSIEPSGDRKFEKSVLKAIQQVERVPAPPPAFTGDAERGVIVTFSARRALQGG